MTPWLVGAAVVFVGVVGFVGRAVYYYLKEEGGWGD